MTTRISPFTEVAAEEVAAEGTEFLRKRKAKKKIKGPQSAAVSALRVIAKECRLENMSIVNVWLGKSGTGVMLRIPEYNKELDSKIRAIPKMFKKRFGSEPKMKVEPGKASGTPSVIITLMCDSKLVKGLSGSAVGDKGVQETETLELTQVAASVATAFDDEGRDFRKAHKKLKRLKDGEVKGDIFKGQQAITSMLASKGFQLNDDDGISTKELKFFHKYDKSLLITIRNEGGKFKGQVSGYIIPNQEENKFLCTSERSFDDPVECLEALMTATVEKWRKVWFKGVLVTVGHRWSWAASDFNKKFKRK